MIKFAQENKNKINIQTVIKMEIIPPSHFISIISNFFFHLRLINI